MVNIEKSILHARLQLQEPGRPEQFCIVFKLNFSYHFHSSCIMQYLHVLEVRLLLQGLVQALISPLP